MPAYYNRSGKHVRNGKQDTNVVPLASALGSDRMAWMGTSLDWLVMLRPFFLEAWAVQ